MITAGIDLGCEWAKIVLWEEGKILSYVIHPYGMEAISAVAQRGFDEALTKAGLHVGQVQSAGVVGSRRDATSLASDLLTESICCARGSARLFPQTRTIIDLGAEKCLVVGCEEGRPLRSARNDRCAAGTGRYLRMVSKLLNVPVEETEPLSQQAEKDVDIETTCAVFAESEIISLLHQKHTPAEIIRGVFKGLAQRSYPLLLNVGLKSDVVMIGGLARNGGLVKAIEEVAKAKIWVPEEPAIVGALGAAIVTWERHRG